MQCILRHIMIKMTPLSCGSQKSICLYLTFKIDWEEIGLNLLIKMFKTVNHILEICYNFSKYPVKLDLWTSFVKLFYTIIKVLIKDCVLSTFKKMKKCIFFAPSWMHLIYRFSVNILYTDLALISYIQIWILGLSLYLFSTARSSQNIRDMFKEFNTVQCSEARGH